MRLGSSRLWTGTALAVLFFAGCSLSIPDDVTGGVRNVPDAALEASSTVDTGTQTIAPIDSGPDACTTAPSTKGPFILPLASQWTLRGNAVASADGVRLTDAVEGGQDGALWWSEPVPSFGRFDATFSVKIDGDASSGDGMTFAWVGGTDIPAMGDGGGGLGAYGLNGYAVSLDILNYGGTDPVDAPFIGLANTTVDTEHWYLTARTIPGFTYGTDHLIRVALDTGGFVSVWFDGEPYIDRFQIPAYAPYRGYWGFTGGTGGQYAAQTVTSAAFVDRTGDPCP